jgi:hypothetical protein
MLTDEGKRCADGGVVYKWIVQALQEAPLGKGN